METIADFILFSTSVLTHASERRRAEVLLERWGAAWQGTQRALELTSSNHGAYLHFKQCIGKTWSQVFTFHASRREGLVLRGPDTDRARKSHKLRAKRLDATGLDALLQAWSAHPEARPAGNAVEFYLHETPDEVWEACLQEALQHL